MASIEDLKATRELLAPIADKILEIVQTIDEFDEGKMTHEECNAKVHDLYPEMAQPVLNLAGMIVEAKVTQEIMMQQVGTGEKPN